MFCVKLYTCAVLIPAYFYCDCVSPCNVDKQLTFVVLALFLACNLRLMV